MVISKHALGTKQQWTLWSKGVIEGMSKPAPQDEPLTVPTIRKSVTPMHRDTKLGLALAILVMGFAAALCFPRTPGEHTDSLALQTAQELDSGIRLGRVKAYTDADRPKPRVVDVTVAPATESASAVMNEAEVLPVVGVPEPVAATPHSEPTPINPGNLPPEVVVEPELPVVHHLTYTVKHNDTLSSIAKDHLGDGSKWREIYDANRNVISDERALRPEMVIVIPIPEGDELTPASPVSTPIATTPSVETPARTAPTTPVQPSVRKRFGSPSSRIGSNAEPRLQ